MATVEKRGKGYRITVAAGIDLNGKQIRHRLNWTPDEKLTPRQVEKELNRQIARFEEQVKTGSIAAEGNIRFADFAERYMANYGRPNLKPTTLSNYQRNLVRINQAIGHIRLKDLTTFHIQAFYRNLQESGIRSREVATCKADLMELIGNQRGAMTAFSGKSKVSRATIKQAVDGKPINRTDRKSVV